MPARVRGHLVLHLHRLDNADHLPASTASPSATFTSRTVPCIGLTTAPDAARAAGRRALASPAGELAVGGSGTSTFTSTRRPSTSATVDALDLRAGPARDAWSPRRQLLRPSSELGRLDDPVARLPRAETRVREQRLVEADQGLHAADPILAERAQHAPDRVVAVGAAHDQLRDHRVVERRDLEPFGDAGVDAHARARRLAVEVIVPGDGRKPFAGPRR